MTINKEKEGGKLTIGLVGRLDTTTAPQLENELKDDLDGIQELIIDMAELEYLSSAGLRVLLSTHKRMVKQGSMTVRNVNEIIMEVFEVTGFSSIINIV